MEPPSSTPSCSTSWISSPAPSDSSLTGLAFRCLTDVAVSFLGVFLVTLSFFVAFETEREECSPRGDYSRTPLIFNDRHVIVGDQVEGSDEWIVNAKIIDRCAVPNLTLLLLLLLSGFLNLASIRLDLIAQYSFSVSPLSIPRPWPGLFLVCITFTTQFQLGLNRHHELQHAS